MADRRQYTGTQRLQLLWSLGIILVVAAVLSIEQPAGVPVSPIAPVLVLSVVWFLGLAALGFRDRRQWNRMVQESSFSRQGGPHTADLERLIEGRSVTVSTRVPGVTAQTHSELRTSVAGIDASFTVRFSQERGDETERGVTTGDEQFDQRFVVLGSEQNVERILTPEVRSALLTVTTPGVCVVTGDSVSYEVPFTSLSGDELDTIAEMLVVIAAHVEVVGGRN